MSFQSPHLLWILVPLGLLFAWELARHATRSSGRWPKIARAWAGAFDVTLGTRHTTAETRPRLWLWLGLACCTVALARPQWGVIEEKVFDQSREVLIALDLSKSMLSQDVKPSRLDRSKLMIQSLLDDLKGERVGLVLFAGTAFLQSPLSSDYEVLREFLPSLTPDYLPEGGSDYRAMLEASMQAFGTSTADRYLIVLSDGESTTDDWRELTEPLKKKGVRVIGLGVGTAQGSLIPDGNGGYVKDERGAVVMSHLNSSTLQELAQVTGGAYTDASAWIDLAGLLRKTVEAGRKGEFAEKDTSRRSERFQWFLAPGLLLLLISFWAEFPVRPRERALPLGRPRGAATPATGVAAVLAGALLAAVTLASPPRAHAASSESAPTADEADAISKPLSLLITRLADQDRITARDCGDLAEATVTYGKRMKSTQQHPPEKVIRDGLAAVDEGEKLDPAAANWKQLRQDLEDLIEKQPPPPEKKKPDQPKQQNQQNKGNSQDQNQDQNQPQNQNQNQQSQDQKSQDRSQSGQDQKPDQGQKNNQNAFGNMKDEPPQPQPKPPDKPDSGTQKVGGQQERKPEGQDDPQLAIPLQKLEQVRTQDSPAKLQQIMQGVKPQKTKNNGKDW